MPDDYLDSDETIDTVVADSSTPRVFGILNIIFSLLVSCMAAYTLMMALYMPAMFESMEEAQATAQTARDEQVEALKEEGIALQNEASEEGVVGTTEERKAEIQAEIDLLETDSSAASQANPFAAMQDPKVRFYGIIDGTTSLFLNLLMFVSGVGLLFCKEWARKLALWTAGLKIVRLLTLQAVNMVVIIPITVKHMQEMFSQMDVGGGPGGPGMAGMAGMQGVMLTSWAVVLMIGGSIYPALSLWFLSRPRVKATCQMIPEEAEAL